MLQTGSFLSFLLLVPLPDAITVELGRPTVEAFDGYMRSVEARFDQQTRDGPSLWVDRSPARQRQVRQGQVLAEPWAAKGDIPITDGLVHDWIGAVFIPGATLEKSLPVLEDYDNQKNVYRPEVMDSKLLSRKDGDFKVYLRLLKKQILTVVLNSEHEVHYVRMDGTRWYSKSYSTRIAEVIDPGGRKERERPPGSDHGFLWRLNSLWRFEERDGGLYVECEAVSLTRNVPTGLGWLINPIIRALPRDSLADTLRQTKAALGTGGK
jgi:hypothetical protein